MNTIKAAVLVLVLMTSFGCTKNRSWLIEGHVFGEKPNGRIVALFINGEEYARTISRKTEERDGYFFFSLVNPRTEHRSVTDHAGVGNIEAGQVEHFKEGIHSPSYDIGVVSYLQENSTPELRNEALALDVERKIVRDGGVSFFAGGLSKTASKLFLVVLGFTVIFSLVKHFVPEFLPTDRNEQSTKLVSIICAISISSIFAIFIFTSASTDQLLDSITSGASKALSASISILFISIAAFLFWRKLKAFLK